MTNTETFSIVYTEFLKESTKDPNILGVILAGSRARGLENDRSDCDIYMIFKNSVDSQLIHEYDRQLNEKYGEALRLDISNKALMTIGEFGHYAEIGTEYYYDRYNLVHSKIEVDKTQDELERLLGKIGSYSHDEQATILKNDLAEYISLTYQAMKSFEADRATAAILDAAESIQYLLSSLFVLNNRIRPYNKYLEWELVTHPLEELPWPSQVFLVMLRQSIKETDLKTLQKLYVGIEQLARRKGYGHKYDAWGEKIKYVNRATF